VKNVQLDLNTVRAFCDACQRICRAAEFDFILQGAICRSDNINGTQMFVLPKEINPKFRALLDATLRFEKEIASVGLSEKDMNLFVAEFFEHVAYAAKAQRVVLEVQSKLLVTNARATVALAALLENAMQEAIASVEVTITAEMLEEKRKEMDARSNAESAPKQ
jgi:hypothetical protein